MFRAKHHFDFHFNISGSKRNYIFYVLYFLTALPILAIYVEDIPQR